MLAKQSAFRLILVLSFPCRCAHTADSPRFSKDGTEACGPDCNLCFIPASLVPRCPGRNEVTSSRSCKALFF
eukprot:1904126-Prorocentrum_lima.AAC.1